MRSAVSTLVVSPLVAITLVLAAPCRSLAEEPWRPNQRTVQVVGTGTRSPFDAEALRRAVETTPRASSITVQTAPPVAAGRDSVWNGVLIGAAIGGVLGGVAGANGDCSTGVSSDCDTLTGQAVGAGILLGGLVGAGLGAIVDLMR